MPWTGLPRVQVPAACRWGVMYRQTPSCTGGYRQKFTAGGYRQKFTAGRYRRQPTKNPIWMAAFSVGMRLNPPLA